MKKIVSIVCILLLLVATSNLKVNIHFCGGEISSIDFFGKSSTCGSGCNSKAAALKEKSCCKNLSAIITTSTAKSSDYSFQIQQQTATPIPAVFVPAKATNYVAEILKGSISSNAPPDLSAQPYYILYRSLII